jgi:hypothetical protein
MARGLAGWRAVADGAVMNDFLTRIDLYVNIHVSELRGLSPVDMLVVPFEKPFPRSMFFDFRDAQARPV